MAQQGAGQSERLIDRALGRSEDVNAPVDLRRKPRIHESVIKAILLFCGVLSIFTTVGIIFVLGNESISFFTRQLWEQTNKVLAYEIDTEQTVFQTEAGGASLQDDDIIRISEEEIQVIEYDANRINIDVIGSGAGIERFCAGELDIANASRAMTAEEIETCRANDIEPLEFRVGTDAIAVVVNPANTWATYVTSEELALIFGGAETWQDVRADWPDLPIERFIPGTDSGTFDYFAEAIMGEDTDALLTGDPVTSEDDTQLTRNIRERENAVGFFGFAYYLENQDSMTLVSIDGVMPSVETVEDDSYSLARPLYIYSAPSIMQAKPPVAAFIDYYLTHVNEEIVEVGYFAASEATLNQARQVWLDTMGVEADALVDGVLLLPDVNVNELAGSFAVGGSSTVFPLTERIAERFNEDGFLPRLVVERGINNTEPIRHRAGSEVERGERVNLITFFTHTIWQPAIGEFGVIPLITATLMTSTIAMLVALPLGLGAAIYLSEYAPTGVRATLKPILEILAGIPTVVYGYFALTFMTPLLRTIFGVETVQIYNTASAGIVVGILIIPLVSSMSEDALHAVPRALREASYGLGANRLETTIKVVIPAALSGILAAFIVSISRAIGETMIVAIAAGAGPNFTFNPFESAETMTGHIARISGGDLSYDSIDYNSIFAIGLALFVITLVLNVLSRQIIKRFRETY
jgi:phosphate transport system permease protein